jgi:cyanophycin synthetase
MKRLEIQTFCGPNLYRSGPVLRIRVGFEPCEAKLLPLRESGLVDSDWCNGDLSRGDVLVKVIRAIATSAGIAGADEIALVNEDPGLQSILVPAVCEESMRFAVEAAIDLLEAIENGREYPIDSKLRELRARQEKGSLGPSTQAIVDAATRRGIPCQTLDSQTSLVRLGWGANARTIQASISSRTSGLAMDIASNKDLTKRLLADAGIPVPSGQLARSAEEAVQSLREIGAPVVVKPLDGNQGRGVCLNLTTEEEVREAFTIAQKHSKEVVVEQLFCGRDYRVLVIDGRLVAASEKSPAQVVGDGRHSIRELIEELNRDPRRGDHHSKPLSLVKVDAVMEAFLRRRHRNLETIPKSGECVALRDSANLSTGGEARDVTDLVHPEIRLLCERAARVIGLDICGLDVVLPDIGRPYEGAGGIIEVNAAPGLRMHQSPSEGRPRDAGAAIVDMLFPNGSDGRIPVVATMGTGITTATLISQVLSFAGKCVGEAGPKGVAIERQQVRTGPASTADAARIVLNDPAVEAAIVEVSRESIASTGLPFDWCDVAVIDSAGASIAELGPERLLAGRVRRDGAVVLHADNPGLHHLRESLQSNHCKLVLCSLDSQHRAVKDHLAAGGSACVLHGDWLELHRAESARRVVRASAIRAALGAAPLSSLTGALAAVAASAALGVPSETITAALAALPSISPAYLNGFYVMPFEERSRIFTTMRGSLRVPA